MNISRAHNEKFATSHSHDYLTPMQTDKLWRKLSKNAIGNISVSRLGQPPLCKYLQVLNNLYKLYNIKQGTKSILVSTCASLTGTILRIDEEAKSTAPWWLHNVQCFRRTHYEELLNFAEENPSAKANVLLQYSKGAKSAIKLHYWKTL